MEMGNKLLLINLKVEGLENDDDLGEFEEKDDGEGDPEDKGLEEDKDKFKDKMDTDQQNTERTNKEGNKSETPEPSRKFGSVGSKTVPLWTSMFLEKDIEGAVDSDFGEMQCVNLLKEMELVDSDSEEEKDSNLNWGKEDQEIVTLQTSLEQGEQTESVKYAEEDNIQAEQMKGQ
uniref:Uncharacterized protein n=1 Tax=Arundo donax TaxID=35708 RepID=A0A0A8ZI43_ARUDO